MSQFLYFNLSLGDYPVFNLYKNRGRQWRQYLFIFMKTSWRGHNCENIAVGFWI
jgi:hypothetical protein